MKAVRHFGIVVSDIKKSLYFYTKLLGLKTKRDVLEKGKFIDTVLRIKNVKVRTVKMAADDGLLIELLWYKSHQKKRRKNKIIYDIGASHPAFTVKKLDEEYKKLKKQGIKFYSQPQVSPDGKAKVAFCRDPDNVPIELVEELN